MNWFWIAILGHVSNGVAFIIDKALLSTAFKRSGTYAGLVGLLSLLVLVAIPWIKTWPSGWVIWIAAASGAGFVLALWAFFGALARAEASRVVPIVGSLIPILTLVGTFLFLGERLTAPQLVGFAVLVIATVILSSTGGNARPSAATLGLATMSALLFAMSSVTGKAVYDAAGFLPGFVSTRIAAAITALLVVGAFDPTAGRELWSIIRPNQASRKKTAAQAAGLALLGQSLGAVGFFFVQLATARGSASLVNALQAVQYAILVLAAFALHRRAPQLLGERLDRGVVLVKIAALALTAVGLALVV
ncbi:EamA family transporter [Candidatus Uhrbacteria bacterium]|nr:EamA family transporter [Candidatus Uhrbacteria bacterium]